MVIICIQSDCGSSDHIPFNLLNGCNRLVYGEEVLDLWLEVTRALVEGMLHNLLHASGRGLHRQVLNEIDTGVSH